MGIWPETIQAKGLIQAGVAIQRPGECLSLLGFYHKGFFCAVCPYKLGVPVAYNEAPIACS